jgi:hypothetical protein
MSRYPELLEKLNAGRDEYLAATADLTDAEATIKPSDGGWSILECAEHVAVVEMTLFQRLASPALLQEGTGRNLEARIVAAGLNRTRKFDAPEPARPNGRFVTLDQAVNAFSNARARHVGWLDACEQDLRCCSVVHPAFGTVTAYEMVLFAAMHPWRHSLQIRELRALREAE